MYRNLFTSVHLPMSQNSHTKHSSAAVESVNASGSSSAAGRTEVSAARKGRKPAASQSPTAVSAPQVTHRFGAPPPATEHGIACTLYFVLLYSYTFSSDELQNHSPAKPQSLASTVLIACTLYFCTLVLLPSALPTRAPALQYSPCPTLDNSASSPHLHSGPRSSLFSSFLRDSPHTDSPTAAAPSSPPFCLFHFFCW